MQSAGPEVGMTSKAAGGVSLVRDVAADVQALSRIVQEVEEFAAAAGVASAPAQRVSLAIDELVTNIILYAQESGDPVPVHLEVHCDPGEVRVVIEHSGVAFDPFVEAPVPDTSLPLAERPIGGLGVFLVRSLMSDTRYERVGDRNRVILTRTLDGGGQEEQPS